MSDRPITKSEVDRILSSSEAAAVQYGKLCEKLDLMYTQQHEDMTKLLNKLDRYIDAINDYPARNYEKLTVVEKAIGKIHLTLVSFIALLGGLISIIVLILRKGW